MYLKGSHGYSIIVLTNSTIIIILSKENANSKIRYILLSPQVQFLLLIVRKVKSSIIIEAYLIIYNKKAKRKQSTQF